jgi:hypothetical protein
LSAETKYRDVPVRVAGYFSTGVPMRDSSLPAVGRSHTNTVVAFPRNFAITLTAFAQQSLYFLAFVDHSRVCS